MDAYIKIALERAADIRRILKEVSGSEKDESWLPISVVCEKCGKIIGEERLLACPEARTCLKCNQK